MCASQKKTCARCEKIVYPTEELKCLDKIWHKGCLKCSVCGTTLNLNSVKGFDRMPYCQPHYPQPKPTTIVNEAELDRLRSLSQFQSQNKYQRHQWKNSSQTSNDTDRSNRKFANEEKNFESARATVDRLTEGERGTGDQIKMKVRAIFPYRKADDDEISFDEGDLIVECQLIDEGWMFGIHSGSGEQGLLPSNYVQIEN